MAWEYWDYIGFILVIPTGITIFIFVVTLYIFEKTTRGKVFVQKRMVGLDSRETYDVNENNEDSQRSETNDGGNSRRNSELTENQRKYVKGIDTWLCSLAALTVSVVFILLFQSCILTNVRVSSDEDCPEYPMACFILSAKSFFPNKQ